MKPAIFVAATVWLLFVSRASLRAPGSHGFWRFFAWECMLALFLLNADRWFDDPLSARQNVSWALLLSSAFLVAHAVRVLRRAGRRDARRKDEPLYEFERTAHLVTEGAHAHIRHPMYASLLLLAWGILLKDPSALAAVLAAAATGLLVTTARADEAECLRYFGEPYREYMDRTRRFIPRVF